jgi:hypothetical protein
MNPSKPMMTMPGKKPATATPLTTGPKKPAAAPAKAATPTKYGKSSLEGILAAADKVSAGRSRFAPKEPAEYLIRMLPPPPGQEHAFRAFGLHYDPSLLPGCLELGDKMSVICVKMTYGEDCPLCKIVERLYAKAKVQTNPEVKKQLFQLAGKTRARARFVINIVWVDQPNRGVLTWEMSDEIFPTFATLSKRWGMVDDPEEGQVLSVTFKKSGDWNKPSPPSPTGDKSPIPYARWAEELHDLDAYVQSRFMPPSEIIALINGSMKPAAAPAAVEEEPAYVAPAEPEATEEGEVDEDLAGILAEMETE